MMSTLGGCVLFLTVFVCGIIEAQNVLYQCDVCKCCKGACDVNNNYACDAEGCKDGYWGKPQCRHKCYDPYPCISCGQIGGAWCDKCGPGYYTQQSDFYGHCTYQCNRRCEICDGHRDRCTVCKEGYANIYGQTSCGYRCPPKCSECSSSDVCSACRPGYFDITAECAQQCLQNCLNCTDARACDQCKPGYFGVKCDKVCPENCIKCDVNGTCLQCNDTFYGPACESNCSVGCTSTTCDVLTGDCPSCWKGFVGTNCSTCEVGKYGASCERSCSINCMNSICNREDGVCTNGCTTNAVLGDKCDDCVPGYFGRDCAQRCSTKCKNSECFMTNGTCKECTGNFDGNLCLECKQGFYGANCTETCHQNCLNGVCNKTGNCHGCKGKFTGPQCDSCIDGTHGEGCELRCSVGCSYSACYRTNGTCKNGCRRYYSGDMCCLITHPGKCSICENTTNCKACVPGSYGDQCNKQCNSSCLNQICDFTTGDCADCQDSKFGKGCELDCPEKCFPLEKTLSSRKVCHLETGHCVHGCKSGHYGQLCNQTCHSNCVENICEQQDGRCKCIEGFGGPSCAEALTDGPKSKLPIAAIGGAAGAVVFIILVGLVVAAFIFRRRRPISKKEENNGKKINSEIDMADVRENSVTDFKDDVNTYANANVITDSSTNYDTKDKEIDETEIEHPLGGCETDLTEENVYANSGGIQVSELHQYVSKTSTASFLMDFQEFPTKPTASFNVSQQPLNNTKNRYKGIYPYDHTRVTVANDPNFYLNASFINGYDRKNAYIASLGPTTVTTDNFNSFWKMVWFHNVDVIVMLTNLEENGVEKCEKYWPNLASTMTYGAISVSCENENVFAEYTSTMLKIMKNMYLPDQYANVDGNERIVYHLHYTVWPDKSVPQDITGLVEFREKVNSIRGGKKGPVVVHCSAGVGRTGTYIALDILTEEGKVTGSVNIPDCILTLRQQRVYMVQTGLQYAFLHKCLVHTLTTECGFMSPLETHDAVHNGHEEQFGLLHKMLNVVKLNEDGDEEDARENNKLLTTKNRHGADVPGDLWRPKLACFDSSDSEYINAVYINTFTTLNGIILAQSPLPDTVQDFLRLVYQTKVSCIVCLDDVDKQRKDIGTYLPPDSQMLTMGDFNVSCDGSFHSDNFIERNLTLAKSGPDIGELTVHYFQYSKWQQNQNVPEEAEYFVNFVQHVHSIKKTPSDVMLVHCLTGADRSALFGAVSILIEKQAIEHQVSVLNILKKIKLRRNSAFPVKEQVEFCFKCLAVAEEGKDIYYNL